MHRFQLLAAENFFTPEKIEEAKTWLATQGGKFAMGLLSAVAVFIIGRWVAGLAVRVVERITQRAGMDITLQKFVCNMLYGLIITFVVIASLGQLGVETSSISAVIAAAGLAVGFALQGSLSNFASGVMMIIFKPFKVGDLIEAAGLMGTVEEIGIFCTIMTSIDNKRSIVPNGSITDGNITNYSANGVLRLDMVFGCGYEDDIRAVKAFLVDLINSDERVLEEPEPTVAVSELADSSVNFVVRPYVRVEDYWGLKWDITEAVKIGFDERGFSIPYPQSDLHVHRPADESDSEMGLAA